MKKQSILLVMHGMPPKDFPGDEKKEFMRLHNQVHGNPNMKDSDLMKRHDDLENKMRNWPRTPLNDAFHEASYKIAEAMERQSGSKVTVGFNEFCAPSMKEAFEAAAQDQPDEIIVITPMVTRGGSHSEDEIPEELDEIRMKYPKIEIKYAWPFSTEHTAQFLLEQVAKF